MAIELTEEQRLALALALDDWLDIWSNDPDQPAYYAAIKTVRDLVGEQEPSR